MSVKKEKKLQVRLDKFDWCMLDKLTKSKSSNRSEMIRYLIEKEFIELNEK